MAKDRTIIQSPDPGVGTPPRDDSRLSDILHVEVAKLQSDGEYIKRDLGELRTDMRDLVVRMAKLETNVSHLPGKGFTVVVVTSALLIGGAIASALFGLQNYLSAKQLAPVAAQAAPAAAPLPSAPKSPKNSN